MQAGNVGSDSAQAAPLPALDAPDPSCLPHIYDLYTRLNREEKVNQAAKLEGE